MVPAANPKGRPAPLYAPKPGRPLPSPMQGLPQGSWGRYPTSPVAPQIVVRSPSHTPSGSPGLGQEGVPLDTLETVSVSLSDDRSAVHLLELEPAGSDHGAGHRIFIGALRCVAAVALVVIPAGFVWFGVAHAPKNQGQGD